MKKYYHGTSSCWTGAWWVLVVRIKKLLVSDKRTGVRFFPCNNDDNNGDNDNEAGDGDDNDYLMFVHPNEMMVINNLFLCEIKCPLSSIFLMKNDNKILIIIIIIYNNNN